MAATACAVSCNTPGSRPWRENFPDENSIILAFVNRTMSRFCRSGLSTDSTHGLSTNAPNAKPNDTGSPSVQFTFINRHDGIVISRSCGVHTASSAAIQSTRFFAPVTSTVRFEQKMRTWIDGRTVGNGRTSSVFDVNDDFVTSGVS